MLAQLLPPAIRADMRMRTALPANGTVYFRLVLATSDAQTGLTRALPLSLHEECRIAHASLSPRITEALLCFCDFQITPFPSKATAGLFTKDPVV